MLTSDINNCGINCMLSVFLLFLETSVEFNGNLS